MIKLNEYVTDRTANGYFNRAGPVCRDRPEHHKSNQQNFKEKFTQEDNPLKGKTKKENSL